MAARGEVSGETQGSVKQTSPLLIWCDGDDDDDFIPSMIDSAVTITVGSRVRVQVRNPRLPLVTGVMQ